MRAAVMLLYDYLGVLNSALVHSPDSQLIRDLRKLGETALDGSRLGIVVVPDEERFAIRFNGKSFALMPDEPPVALVWRAPRDYLERVIDDPSAFIDQPERLDWDWLWAAATAEARPAHPDGDS